jgi:hypothetical protein
MVIGVSILVTERLFCLRKIQVQYKGMILVT